MNRREQGGAEARRGVVVVQLGARMHYAVPVLLHRAGMLAHFYTDACADDPLLGLGRLVPKPLRPPALHRLLGRRCGLPKSRFTSFRMLGLSYGLKLRKARSAGEVSAAYLWAGRQLGRLVVKRGLHNAAAAYGFQTASEEVFRCCRDGGVVCVLEQTIAPMRIIRSFMQDEMKAWPCWQTSEHDPPAQAFSDREAREWELADAIFCGSKFVAESLAACGADPAKCIVVPYGIDLTPYANIGRGRPLGGTLRVLFVGTVGLRKGITYLLEAVRRLKGVASLRVVGPVCCDTHTLEGAAATHDVTIIGQVPRSEIRNHFNWAHVLCLPSLCEGSATVTYEALAAGVPVICTPNAGSVVRHGVDGFIVPIRSSKAIAGRLKQLAGDRKLLAEMSANARSRAREFSWERYGQRLAAALAAVMEKHKG